jgi:tRNA(Ile)-lysidine synthase TilS/MesJ
MERYQEIERSIITKFRKPLWKRFINGVNQYQLIQEGDKIAVCISGGKDSMLLAKLMQEVQRHGNVPFEQVFLVMDPGYNEINRQTIINNAKLLDIPVTIFDTQIYDIVAGVDASPCYLCARVRRGYLNKQAQEMGCNKIALGHHFDDVIETILMGMLYAGQIQTMMPKLHSTNHPGMQLIRPMYLVKEADILAWKQYHGLQFIQCACRLTENCTLCDNGGGGSKRQEMKALIKKFRQTNPSIDTNIFRSVQDVNLKTIIGYHDKDRAYHFLDDYDTKGGNVC